MWRLALSVTACLAVAACGNSGPPQAANGPRLEACLAAVWPASAPPRQAVFSRDGKLAAFADASGAILIRNVADWSVAERLRHHGGATSVAFSKGGTHLFSGGYDGNVREWDLARHNVAQLFKGGGAVIWTIDVSPDGKQLAAGGEDSIIRLWSIDQPARPALLRGHTRNVWEVRFSPDDRRLASGSFDDSVRIWDSRTGRLLKTLAGHTRPSSGSISARTASCW